MKQKNSRQMKPMAALTCEAQSSGIYAVQACSFLVFALLRLGHEPCQFRLKRSYELQALTDSFLVAVAE